MVNERKRQGAFLMRGLFVCLTCCHVAAVLMYISVVLTSIHLLYILYIR